MQIGCELTGANTTTADLEILIIAVEILDRLGLKQNFVITLNDVEVVNGIAESLELKPGQRNRMQQLVDARNIADLEKFFATFATARDAKAMAQLIDFPAMNRADVPNALARARAVIVNQRSGAALVRLEQLWRALASLGLTSRFVIDLSDVSRLDYYTGLTFKIYVDGAGARVGSGGRYDNLTANFGGAEPAIGFVLDLDALTEVLLLLEPNSSLAPQSQGVALHVGATDRATIFREAIRRRTSGERVLVKSAESIS